MISLYVAKMPKGTTPEELRVLFGKFGPGKIEVPTKGEGKYAFVDVPENIYEEAIAKMHGTSFKGSALLVQLSERSRRQTEAGSASKIESTPTPSTNPENQMSENSSKVSGILETVRDTLEKIRSVNDNTYAAPRFILGVSEELKFAVLMLEVNPEHSNTLLLDFIPQLQPNQAADFVMKSIGMERSQALKMLSFLAVTPEDRRIRIATSLQLIREEYLADQLGNMAEIAVDQIPRNEPTLFGRLAARVVR